MVNPLSILIPLNFKNFLLLNLLMLKKRFNSRGLSTIIATLLILLLVLIAVGIIWIIVKNVIQGGAEQISSGKLTLDLKIEQVQKINDSQLNVIVKRNPGGNEFVGISFIIDDGDNTEIVKVNYSLIELETKNFQIILTELNASNIKKISIAPIFRLKSGKEVTGDINDEYELTSSAQSPSPISETSDCITHEYSFCHDGDVYWYNSCDVIEEIKTDCNSNQICTNSICEYKEIYEAYNPYGFELFGLKYYINPRAIYGCLVYDGANSSEIHSLFNNKNLIINTTIILNNGSISRLSSYLVNDNLWDMFLNNNEYCDSKLILIGFYETELTQIKEDYPNKIVPYKVQFALSDENETVQVIYNQTDYLYFDFPYDKREYQIGVIQVLPPEMKLEDLKLCFNGGTWANNPYYFGEINVNCPVLSGWDRKEFNFNNLFLSENTFNYIKNVSYLGQGSLDNTKIYSFKYIGKYWENLLANQELNNMNTLLGKNPKFNVTFLPPLYKENSLHSNDPPIVRRFFSEAVTENNVNLSEFDFIIYMQYIPRNTPPPYFSLGFSKLNEGYIPLYFGKEGIVVNDIFIAIVHEMGHMLFSLNDLYFSYNIKYPEGVPNPLNFPQNKSCLMAGSFGYRKISDNLVERYDLSSDPGIFPPGVDMNYIADPTNQILCVKDIVTILNQQENPDCPVVDFYAGNCGNCTAENYLTCYKS